MTETEDERPLPVTVPAGYRVDRWLVGQLLGDGGWGSVYSGEPADPQDGPVALKFLPPARLAPAQRSLLGEIVERETEFSQLADHANLIRTRAVLTLRDPEDPNLDGAVVLVMDRAQTSLRELLVHATAGVALPEAERILVEVCRAIAEMHSRGWIHGDLKPGNVLLMADGSVRLADFGLTARVEGTHAYVPRIGSSDYLPPEWWSERVGERGIPQRPSADVWAFGVLAHQVLTGGLYPFPGTSSHARAFAVQAYARGTAQLRLDDRIPATWRELIIDCLTPDPTVRSQVAITDVLEGAEAIRSGGAYSRSGADSGAGSDAGATSGAESESDAETASASGTGSDASARPPRRRMRVLVSAAAIVALAAGGTAWWLTGDGTPETPHAGATATAIAAGSLSEHADVPFEYRSIINGAANLCAAPAVTPALIAGILKAESNFDPNFSSPQTASFGIAGWTPAVFHAWANAPQQDYMNPNDAIPAVARFLCWLDGRFTAAAIPGDRATLLAAGYDTSDMAVIRAKGVPASATKFAAAAIEYATEFEH
ncbi:serine/threonine protein kinase [Actinocrinis sp.]|uniref:serine/threonine protein kinase n=1 Tax=Actinocrinis sp. TaxID=1920516 RepID=UPI002D50BEBD|nr:protein kinase [Actinocrinis sp.]HZP55140.1 protein kinase [Actinocrinis sp.]